MNEDTMQSMWDGRYRERGVMWGSEPNRFVVEAVAHVGDVRSGCTAFVSDPSEERWIGLRDSPQCRQRRNHIRVQVTGQDPVFGVGSGIEFRELRPCVDSEVGEHFAMVASISDERAE